MSAFIDLTGQRFGKWTVVERVPRKKGAHGNTYWSCRCDCGRMTKAPGTQLTRGITRRCQSCAQVTHGKSLTPTYRVWVGMRQRCGNPNHVAFASYGGSGITVCDRWRTSFANFLADMGERPGPDYQLDRIDGTKGYDPTNVKWVPVAENQRNKRTNVYIDAADVRNLLTALEHGERVVWADLGAYLSPPRARLARRFGDRRRRAA